VRVVLETALLHGRQLYPLSCMAVKTRPYMRMPAILTFVSNE